MNINSDLPSYEELFADLNFKQGDEARSVLSPAAYLADLLQLLEDKFQTTGLNQRRSDIPDLVLDSTNTYTSIPYLDIVNSILEKKVGDNTYETLKTTKYPFNLPFNFENERIKKFLYYLNVTSENLYKLFSLQYDSSLVGREYLQLSIEEYNSIVQSSSKKSLKEYFGKVASFEPLQQVSQFLKVTCLSEQQLRELLYQDLSETAKNPSSTVERSKASDFFINNQLNGYASLNEAENIIIWNGRASAIPEAWFDRVNRLVRLNKKIGLSLTELDLILCSCCQNHLDERAIQNIAIIKQLHDRYDIEIDVACSFFSNINVLGIGNENEPKDLFNRVFNVPFANLDKKYLHIPYFIPEKYAGHIPLTCLEDLLSANQKEYRKRLYQALNISDQDLTLIVNQFRARSTVDGAGTLLLNSQQEIGLPALSLLFRVVKLAQMLDLSYEDLFNLFDILGKDPAIRISSNFNILIHPPIQEQDCYKIIAGNDIQASMWLVQVICAIAQWIQANDFTTGELKQWLTGSYKNEVEAKTSQEQKLAFLNNLYQQFTSLMFSATLFESEEISSRSARIIYQAFIEQGSHLVASKDNRLVKYDPILTEAAAYRALNRLERIRPEDFIQLGLEQKMLDKIFNNLILKEYITTEGTLIEEHFPKSVEHFQVETDFSHHREALFSLIYTLFMDAMALNEDEILEQEVDEEDGENMPAIEFSVYPSDLEALDDLSEEDRNELYENLIFNGYIDEEGNVLQANFFALSDNIAYFEVGTPLTAHSADIFYLILAQIKQFDQEELILDKEIFSELPLKAFEIDNLIENLKFNEYINQDHGLINKAALLSATPAQFNLALTFYPYRRQILSTIQTFIRKFKSDFYTLSRDLFFDIADEIVAQQIYQYLAVDYLQDGLLLEDQEAFFLDSDNLEQFVLPSYFTDNDAEIIFSTIQATVSTTKKYQFTPQILEDLDFTLEEQEELIDLLELTGYIFDRSKVFWDKVPYFLNIDNALDFSLTKFEDYNKDIFFAIHAIAKVIDEAVRAISAQFKELADAQEDVLLEVLQDHFGVEMDGIKTICWYVLQNPESLVEEFLVPTLSVVNTHDEITAAPDNNKFNFAYRRIGQFAALATKLGLNSTETEIVFQDQDLVEKFPEKLVLPPSIDRFDALLDNNQGSLYLFKDSQYWIYSAETYNLLSPVGQTLATLSEQFAGLAKIDAAFTDSSGKLFLLAQEATYCKAKGSERWVQQERVWGQVDNNFTHPQRVDATFQDKEGKTYLFSGDQYIRYSGNDYNQVDEGYPLKIASHWKQDALTGFLPEVFQKSIDAAFQDINGKTYLFKAGQWICLENSDKSGQIHEIWSRVKNNFEKLEKIDAAYTDGADIFIFAGDQVIAYQDSLENQDVRVKEGFPKRLRVQYPNLPAEFVDGVETAFKGEDGQIHLFKAGKVLSWAPNNAAFTERNVKECWGIVRNNILKNGRVDAAFVGLDGKTYLFSADQYVRYSGEDYSQVDEGFPRTIDQDWGGLIKVDAAFILDGKTYLFGNTSSSDRLVYVRYSTHDYTTLDPGYPKEPNDNWWNLPFSLVQEGADFATIDTVFNAQDNKTYLFSGGKFICFDHQHRWWSEPQEIATHWDSIPFASVDAAFTGKDGKTYLFSGTEYIQYSTQDYSQTDDRYPNITQRYWGHVANNIAKTGRVDAVLVVESHEVIAGQEQTTTHTYLFSGNQYFRYRGDQYSEVEEGYPKYIATSLKQEPRFKNLDVPCGAGIDAAFADRRNLYLFKGANCYGVSESLYKSYRDLGLGQVTCAFVDEGAIFLADNQQWQRCSHLEGHTIQKTPLLPPLLRQVPPQFQTGIQAVLQGVDGNTYLFKDGDCFNVSLNKAYPLEEEWGRVKTHIAIHNTVDAAFVGLDGKTYLFSGNQYVTYAATVPASGSYVYGEVEQLPRSIPEDWGGLSSIALAFVKDGKTYLFEKADAKGNARYLCYSTADYSHPDAGFPQVADVDFWQIPSAYTDEGLIQVDAVLFEAENMFLLSGQRYVQFNQEEEQWAYPKPLARIWREIPFNKDSFQRIKTAFTGRDGVTYFFSETHYVAYANYQFTLPTPIQERWGLIRNNFVNHPRGNRVDAAVVLQQQTTYLFSGDQYVRYSSQDYRYVDAGYPKSIAQHLRTEVGFENLPEAFETTIATLVAAGAERLVEAALASDRTLYLLIGTECHAVSQRLTTTYPLSRLGHLKNNIVQKNAVDAALFTESGQTYLFSGDQGVRYSDDTYTYVDDGYPKALATILTEELGVTHLPEAFKYGIDAVLKGRDGKFYLFKDQQYQRSDQSEPKNISDYWGKINNLFVGDSGNSTSDNPTIDAAFIAPSGRLYVFKGNQYIRYTNPEQKFVDEGFPKLIRDNWGNLPIEFETAITGGFVFEGKTYLLKGEDYVRYSDPTYQAIDAIYPQKIKYRWGNWSDYLLGDFHTITRFKQLQNTYSNGEHTLIDFFSPETGTVPDPYQMLADIFSWDIDEVKWLKRKNAFLRADNLFEVQFKLEMILRFFDIFSLAQKMGTTPSELYKTVWKKLYSADAADLSLKDAADALYRFLALIHQA